jgi:phospholipase C
MELLFYVIAVICLGGANPATAGSLADVEHVVLFMQENRAFDHVNLTSQA